jgi:mono/diheme cytochrome c family protein
VSEEISYRDEALKINVQNWSYPTRNQCLSCHNPNAGFVLGVSAAQINKNTVLVTGGTVNQLKVWNDLNFFSHPLSESEIKGSPQLVSLNDVQATDEEKVRSYLASNCSHCHRPGGVDAAFDAQFITPLKDQKIIGEPTIGHSSSPENLIVKPKDLFGSELWVRDVSLGDNAMPPLAKNVVDEEYINVLSRWILTLDTALITGLEENVRPEVSISTTVFPNPFHDAFTLNVSIKGKVMNRAVVRIFDAAGRVMYQNFTVPVNADFKVDKIEWPEGVYYLETILGTVKDTKKIIRK